MAKTFTITDNSEFIINAFDVATDKALYVVGLKADEHIVRYMSQPDFTGNDIVDSGRLRASISFVTPDKESGFLNGKAENSEATDIISGQGQKNTVIIGSNVEYASYVNNGTSKQVARNFLENGINNAIPDIEKLFKETYRGD